MKEELISIENVNKHYGKNHILNGVNFSITKNERVAIVGGNGAGKTTLLNIISGNDKKYKGTVKWNIEKNEMAFQFQTTNYPDNFTVYDLLYLFEKEKNTKESSIKNIINDKLITVGLKKQAKQRPSSLSGGQMQKLNLLLTVATQPKLVFFDEILSGLDQPSIKEVFAFNNRFIKDKMTTITISHNPEEVYKLSDRVVFLQNGVIVSDKSIDKYSGIEELEEEMKKYILDESKISYDEIIGNDFRFKYLGDDFLVVNSVKKNFELNNVLIGNKNEGITFKVKKGERIALIGSNGSGKSTLSEIISGAIKPSSGRVTFFSSILSKEDSEKIKMLNDKILSIADNTGSKHSDELTLLKNEIETYEYYLVERKIPNTLDKEHELYKLDDLKATNAKRYDQKLSDLFKKIEKMKEEYKVIFSKMLIEFEGGDSLNELNTKVNKIENKSIIGKNISDVSAIQFQKQFYPSNLNLRDIVIFNLISNNIKYDEAYVDKILDCIGLLSHKYNSSYEISGGQRQKLNIILTLVRKPQLLILDELTTGLDLVAKNKLITLIKEYLKRSGATLLMITHSKMDIEELANRIMLLKNGKIFNDIKFSKKLDVDKILEEI